MKYIYIPVCVAAAICVVYIAGMRIGTVRCRARVTDDAIARRTEIINKIGEINAETNHTATGDIRMWLRTKYTIAE